MQRFKDIALIILLLLLSVIGGYASYRYYRIQENKRIVTTKLDDSLRRAVDFKFKINKQDSTLKGYFILTPYFLHKNNDYLNSQLIIMDVSGNIHYKKELGLLGSDFRQWKVGGKVYYTYAINDFGRVNQNDVFRAKSHYVVLDAALNEVNQISLYSHGDIKANNEQGLDPHDLIMLSENHFITLAGYEKTVNNIPDSLKPAPKGTKVIACIIQESIDGKVVWQWDATKYPELYSASKDDYSDTGFHDYTHPNGLILDPRDSNIIVSFRDLDQILKINRKTGDIMWRLGGSTSDYVLAPEQVFLGQHAPTLIDNNETLLFVDNGDVDKRPFTRIVEIKLDEKNKKIASYKSTQVPHLFFKQQGNVSKIGNNYLVCGAYYINSSEAKQYICLFDPKTNNYFYDLRTDNRLYRAYLVDSIYGLEKNVVPEKEVAKK